MGFPPLLNLSTRLSTAALPGQTTKMAQTLESMFQNVAYRPTVYRTGVGTYEKLCVPCTFLFSPQAVLKKTISQSYAIFS